MELRRFYHAGLAREVIFPVVALLALTVLRLVVAAFTPLSPDEAYYWVWSRALAGGYYDHPPMVALWIRAGTFLLGDTALGVRLFAPLSAALASVALAWAGAVLTGDRARGVMAAILLNATLALGISAISMTPDTPLLFFWILSLAALGRILAGGHGAWFLVVGLCAGLALASKYSAGFLGLAIALWLLMDSSVRPWLRGPWPWIGGVVAALIFLPVIVWNVQHDWVGFIKQGGRIGSLHLDRAAFYVVELLAGQIGIVTPIIFILVCAGIVLAVRHIQREHDPCMSLLLLLTLLPLPVLLQHTLTDRVQANWPVIIYPSAVLLATMAWPRLHRPAAWLGFALIVPIYWQAMWPVLPIPPKLDPSMKRFAGWAALATSLETTRRAEGATFIAADNYALAAILAWHLPSESRVTGTGLRWATFSLPHPDLNGQSGIFLRSKRLSERLPPAPWAAFTELPAMRRERAGVTAEEYRVYRVIGPAPDPSLVTLPRP